jgi:hypothetical protein
MSDQQKSTDISPEELSRRTRAIRDASNMSPYIPDNLRERLEAGLSDEMRTAVLELQILAIKFGRALESRDSRDSRPVVIHRRHKDNTPSDLALKLVNRAGQQIKRDEQDATYYKEEKKIDILVAPGFLDVTIKH